jgi:hypothetical protein
LTPLGKFDYHFEMVYPFMDLKPGKRSKGRRNMPGDKKKGQTFGGYAEIEGQVSLGPDAGAL